MLFWRAGINVHACTASLFLIWMCVSGCKCHWDIPAPPWLEALSISSLTGAQRSTLLSMNSSKASALGLCFYSTCMCVFQRAHTCICVCGCLCPSLAILIRADHWWQCFSRGIYGSMGQINIWCDFTLARSRLHAHIMLKVCHCCRWIWAAPGK